MSVQSEIDRIKGNVSDAYTAISDKGGELPQTQNTENLAGAINSIPENNITNLVNAPIGSIMIWSGTEDSVPQGWSICNGENGTLDLRDKFVLGAGTHEFGETGGSEEVTLTVDQIPSHNHTITMFRNRDATSFGSGGIAQSYGGTRDEGVYISSNVGNSQPHPNMPPYYTALYIQKTGITPVDYATMEQVETALDSKQDKIVGALSIGQGGTGADTVQRALASIRAKPRGNLIVNGDFRRPVNRKGKASYNTPRQITINNWLNAGYAATLTVYVDDRCVRLVNTTDGNIGGVFSQNRMLGESGLRNGDTVTLSFLIETVSTAYGTLRVQIENDTRGDYSQGAILPVTDGEKTLLTITKTIPETWEANDHIRFTLYEVGSFNVKVYAARLEYGTEQHLAYQDESGEWQLLDEPDYDEEYLRCCLYSLEDGAFVGLPYTNENLLDNAYWAQRDAIINQRGQTEYTDSGFTIDRWILWSGSLEVLEDGISISSSDIYGGINQCIENRLGLMPGTTFTYSCLFSEVSAGWYIDTRFEVDGQTVALESTGDTVLQPGVTSVTVTIPQYDTTKECYVRCYIGSTVSNPTPCKIKAVKLERGSIQTLARQDANDNWVLLDPPPNKCMELAKCHMYQYVIQPTNTVGFSMSGFIEVPVMMRKNPIINAGVKLSIDRDVQVIEPDATFVAYSRPNEPMLTIAKPGTNFIDGVVAVDSGSPVPLILDANL